MEEEYQLCQSCIEDEDKTTALKYYNIIRAHSIGVSYSDISKEFKVDKGQISKLVNKFHQYSDVMIDLRSNNQRPTVLDTDDIDFIREFIEKQDNRLDANFEIIREELQTKRGKKVCCQTILNYLNSIGKYKLPYSVPILSLKNQEKRLEYCEFYKNDRYSNVFFTDESSFQLYQNSLKIFQFYDENQLQKPKPNPNYSVMIWACICRKKKVAIQVVNGSINSEKYISILQEYFPQCGDAIYGKNNWRFQQDNAPSHKSLKTQEWLHDTMPRLIKHPPQSPDLNPVELIWALMKREIEKESPKTKSDLEKLIFKTWDNITIEQINSIIDNLSILKYLISLKAKERLSRNGEILEPGGTMCNHQQLITTNKNEQMEIVREYFDNHYHQNQINNKNYIKKLSSRERKNIIKNLDNKQIATNKSCSFDGISGKVVEIPKKVGRNKTVPQLPTQTAQQRKINNQKIEEIKQKQIKNQKKNIRTLMTEIIKNQKKWHKLYQARQIYLPKRQEDKSIYSCRPITILPTAVKLIETSILKNIYIQS